MDLTLRRGASLLLTGDNGAGKTTLLRITATLLRPSSGGGRIDGLDLSGDAELIRARLAYVSARGFAYDDLTALENLRFTARMVGVAPGRGDVQRMLEAVGLGDALERPVRDYSTGMRRRLALTTLRLRPLRVALIDEPYAGLDTDGVALVDRMVAELTAAGSAVVLASHQAGEATRNATRTVRLEGGRLEEVA